MNAVTRARHHDAVDAETIRFMRSSPDPAGVEVIVSPAVRFPPSEWAQIGAARAVSPHRPAPVRRLASSLRYAAIDSSGAAAGLGCSASSAGTRISAVATHAISPISDARPNPRIARFSLISSEP